MTRSKFTPDLERILLDPSAKPVDRANAIWCMRVDGIQRHEDLIVSLIDHPISHLRAHALVILLRWGRYSYVPLALDRLANDDEGIVRSMTARALSNVAIISREHRDPILRALVKMIEVDPERIISARAYRAALDVLAPGTPWHLDEETFDRERDVDWPMLAPFRVRGTPSSAS